VVKHVIYIKTNVVFIITSGCVDCINIPKVVWNDAS